MTHASPPPFFSEAVSNARRFFLDLAPPPSTSLAVVCGGYEVCEPNYAVRRHSFPYYSIELVCRGRGRAGLAGTDYDLSPGSVFSYGPGVPHAIGSQGRARLGKYFVNFVGTEAGELFTAMGLGPGEHARVGSLPEVQLLFNELVRDGVRGDDASGPMCAALLRCLALRIAAYRIDQAEDGPEPYATYQRCSAYIAANAETLTTQQQAAAECGVSPAYLCRLFRRHGRLRPYQYLTRLRMNLAAERLLDSDAPVKRVAEELGYEDPFHFSRTFKATLGVSPTEFRTLR